MNRVHPVHFPLVGGVRFIFHSWGGVRFISGSYPNKLHPALEVQIRIKYKLHLNSEVQKIVFFKIKYTLHPDLEVQKVAFLKKI